jgi:hypothetical protein
MASRWLRYFAGLVGLCALGFVLLGGLLKLSDLSMFRDALASWRTVPAGWVPRVGTFVPTTDVFLAGAGLLGVGGRWSIFAVLALLAVFTAFYLREWALGDSSPVCGCLGAISSLDAGGAWVVARNAVLMGAIGAGVWGLGLRGGEARTRIGEPCRGARAPRGFTLVETLLVVELVGLLVAFTLPTPGCVREHSRVAATLHYGHINAMLAPLRHALHGVRGRDVIR